MQAKDWDRINKQISAKQFELGARSPISWKAEAIGLKHAADILYDIYHAASLRILTRESKRVSTRRRPTRARTLKGKELEDHRDSQLLPAYFLLSGYALENLLKGILLLKLPEYFRTDGKLTGIKSHDLKDLCKRCGIHPQKKDAALLDRLARYVDWQGKYPVPLGLGKMLPLSQSNGEWIDRGEGFHGRQVQQEVDALYRKFWEALESEQTNISTSQISNVGSK